MSPTDPPPSVVRRSPGKFPVFVDGRFNYMEESQRYLLGEFDSVDAAAEACRKIVDDFLLANFKPAMSADELYAAYLAFGEVPMVSDDGAEQFSAAKYAKSRCGELHGKRAFTTVEMPVVIGILAIVVFLLLPALN